MAKVKGESGPAGNQPLVIKISLFCPIARRIPRAAKGRLNINVEAKRLDSLRVMRVLQLREEYWGGSQNLDCAEGRSLIEVFSFVSVILE
jgi:hypothetical protein